MSEMGWQHKLCSAGTDTVWNIYLPQNRILGCKTLQAEKKRHVTGTYRLMPTLAASYTVHNERSVPYRMYLLVHMKASRT